MVKVTLPVICHPRYLFALLLPRVGSVFRDRSHVLEVFIGIFKKNIWIFRTSRKSSKARYFEKCCYVCLRGWGPSLFGYSRRLFNTLYPTTYIMCASSRTKLCDLPAMVIRKCRTKHNKLNMLGKWRHRIIFGVFFMILPPEFHVYIRT